MRREQGRTAALLALRCAGIWHLVMKVDELNVDKMKIDEFIVNHPFKSLLMTVPKHASRDQALKLSSLRCWVLG